MKRVLIPGVILCGADVAQAAADVPERYWTDWSGTPPQQPLALVRPRSTEDVSALLRLCSAHRICDNF